MTGQVRAAGGSGVVTPVVEETAAFVQESGHQASRLRAGRAESLATTLSPDATKAGERQSKVAGSEVEEFLDPRAGVVQKSEEEVVPLALGADHPTWARRCAQLFLPEIAEYGPRALLHRNGEHPLTGAGQRRLGVQDVAEEAVDGGEPRVPRADRIVAIRLQVREEAAGSSAGARSSTWSSAAGRWVTSAANRKNNLIPSR